MANSGVSQQFLRKIGTHDSENMYFIQFQTLCENKQVSWHQDETGDGKPSSANFFLESHTYLQMYIQTEMHT